MNISRPSYHGFKDRCWDQPHASLLHTLHAMCSKVKCGMFAALAAVPDCLQDLGVVAEAMSLHNIV